MVKGTGPKLVKLEEITLDPDLRQGLAKVFGMKIGEIPKTIDVPKKMKGGRVKAPAKKMMYGSKVKPKTKMMYGSKVKKRK